MKKRATFVVYVFLISSVTFAFWFGVKKWYNHRSIVTVQIVDQNNTPITYNQTKTGRILTRYRIDVPKVSGYGQVDATKKEVSGFFAVSSQTIIIKERPNSSRPLATVKKSKYVAAGFQVLNTAPVNGSQPDFYPNGIDRLRILTSNDGRSWNLLKTNYPNIMVRDPSIKKIGNYWYIVLTDGLLRTKNFKNWANIGWKMSTKQFKFEWAPEFVTDKNGKTHVIVCAQRPYSPDDTGFQLYISDFDIKSGIENNWRKLKGTKLSDNMLDPHMTYTDGEYRLWYKDESTKELHLVSSSNLYDNFNAEINQNTTANQQSAYEAPESVNGLNLLYVDPYVLGQNQHLGMYYATNRNGQIGDFRPIRSTELIRHFSIIRN